MNRFLFVPLLVLLFCAVSAQGFTVTINGVPFQGAVDGESDAAFLEAAALAETPGLDLQVEGTQVKLGGKEIHSVYRQGRVLVDAKALTEAMGGLYEISDAGRAVKLTLRGLASAAPAASEAAPASMPTYSFSYSDAPPDAERAILEAGMTKMLYGIASSNVGMLQSTIAPTCHIHATPGDPTFSGLTNKPAYIKKIIEILGGQSPTKIKARYLPKTKSFVAIVKYRTKELQLLGNCGKTFSIGEFAVGPLSRL